MAMPSLPFDQRFHPLLNLAVGGRFVGAPTTQTSFPASMEVDWVRIYQDAEALLLGLVPEDSKIMRLAAGDDDLRPLIPVQISRLDILHRRLLAT